MKNLLVALFLIFALKINAQVNYIYFDGNSNTYHISETQINYEPVTKENSSSGTFNGGEVKTKNLSHKDFEKLNSLFKEAIASKTEQQQNHEMMTGLLIHKKGKKTIEQIVLKSSSEYIVKIEALLKSLL